MKKFKLLLVLLLLLPLVGCGFKAEKPDNIRDAFKEAGLVVGESNTMTPSDFGLAPYVAKEAIKFEVQGGAEARVFSFKNKDDMEKVKEYYVKIGQASAIFYSHTVSSKDGKNLMQMGGEVSSEDFEKYKEVFLRV